MLKIAICDDRPEELAKISQCLHSYISDHQQAAEISEFSHPDELLLAESKTHFDLYLLDIVMPMLNGIDVGRELRQRQKTAQIIYLTTSDEFAVDAFALKAIHYLLKPFSQEQFADAMDRAVKHFENIVPKYIPVRTDSGELHSLAIADILYIESSGHSITIHARERTLCESRRSLQRLQDELEKLSPGQFIAPYKGYIVNQKAISIIDRDCMTLCDGTKIPIPKREFKALQNRYMDYIFSQNTLKGSVLL